MLFENTYNTISENAKAEFKDRGSKFIGYALKTNNKVAFDDWLKKIRNKYPDATHHCYAYTFHPDKSEAYCADDGEPANSAGKPILRTIQSAEATQVSIIVVRYYGGVNLGLPGLINAYGTAAKLALDKGRVITKDIEEVYTAKCGYGDEQQWYSLLNNGIINILSQQGLSNGYEAIFSCPKKNALELNALFGELFSLEIKFLYFQ